MASIFDLDFNVLTSAPYGFDSLSVTAPATIGSVGGSGGGAANPYHAVGQYNAQGYTVKAAANFPSLDLCSMFAFWCDIEQSPGVYDWTKVRFNGNYIDPDLSIDDAAANGYKIIYRLNGGIYMPIGGAASHNINGTTIQWAAHTFTHLGTTFPGVERVSFVSKGYSFTKNTYIPWAPDPTLRYLYQKLLESLDTWLNGTTSGGHVRKNQILFVPVFMTTEQGTEMSIQFQSGTFAPTSQVTMDDGITYGPGTQHVTAPASSVNQGCLFAHIPHGALPSGATTNDKKVYCQGLWQQAWKDAVDIQAAATPDVNFGLAYEGFWGGSMEANAGPVRDYAISQYGKTQLFNMTTNWTVDYAGYSQSKYNFMQKCLTQGGRVGFQTQDPTPNNSNPGMVPKDWITAMEQALDNFSIHFMESQPPDFGDNTYGPNNIKFATAYSTVATAPSPATSGTTLVLHSGDGSKFPPDPFVAIVWPNGVEPTSANAEILTVANRSGDTLTLNRSSNPIAIGTSYQIGVMQSRLRYNANNWGSQNQQGSALEFHGDTTSVARARKVFAGTSPTMFYLLDLNKIVANSGTIVLLSSQDDLAGTCQLRFDGSNHPKILFGGVVQYTSASPAQNGDIYEVEHVINGNQSGYIFRINKSEVSRNLSIASTATKIAQVDIGVDSAVASTLDFNRFAANDANWVDDPTSPNNPYPPIIDLVSIL